MQPFFALIVPVPGPVEPPQPGRPPGIWGGGNEPFPGYGLPGGPPLWPGYPHPPPGTWGPGSPIIGHPIPIPPGSGGMPPGFYPGGPLPPHGGHRPVGPGDVPGVPPDWSIWGGGNRPFPTPPISGLPGLPGYEPPIIVVEPPVPADEFPVPPPPPEVAPSARLVLHWDGSNEAWNWIVIPPPAAPKPPSVAVPK